MRDTGEIKTAVCSLILTFINVNLRSKLSFKNWLKVGKGKRKYNSFFV
jgi:hypothetical protein